MDELIKKATATPGASGPEDAEQPVDPNVRDEKVKKAEKKKVILEEPGKAEEEEETEESKEEKSQESEEKNEDKAIERFKQMKKKKAKEMVQNLSGDRDVNFETSQERFRKLKREERQKKLEEEQEERKDKGEESDPPTLKEKYDRYKEGAITY